jgi:hypothetical protein
VRRPNCKGWQKILRSPGGITITYEGTISPPPQVVKLFESRTGGETSVDFNHYSALRGVHITGV